MKKLILTILASTLILSCSNNSDSIDSTSSGPLIRTQTSIGGGGTTTYNYNGYKLSNIAYPSSETVNYTYNGDLIIKEENNGGRVNSVSNFNYSNNLLSSLTGNESTSTISKSWNATYSYNSNGSITVMNTKTNNQLGQTPTTINSKHIRYYSQGNCIKDEEYSISNGIATLIGYVTYSYDTKNSPYKNITGLNALYKPQGLSFINNLISEVDYNASGFITSTYQITYQYNSENYPISSSTVYTYYTINPQTGVSTQASQSTNNTTITY